MTFVSRVLNYASPSRRPSTVALAANISITSVMLLTFVVPWAYLLAFSAVISALIVAARRYFCNGMGVSVSNLAVLWLLLIVLRLPHPL